MATLTNIQISEINAVYNTLSEEVVTSLNKYNASDKGQHARLFLKAALIGIVLRFPSHYCYEGEWLENGEWNTGCLLEYIEDIFGDGSKELPTHVTSIKSSGSLGYGILGEHYNV